MVFVQSVKLVCIFIVNIFIVHGDKIDRNSFLEYCSKEYPGVEKICRDTETMKDFNDKEIRLHGAFITYNRFKNYENLVLGWGQCLPRPVGTFVKLLPAGQWLKQRDSNPFIIVISDTIDLFTSYANDPVQIPLYGGKTHVMIVNGELRSFRSDVHRRCVASTPELRGINHYHFQDRLTGDNFMKKYVVTHKDKIFLGKAETEECGKYAKMSPEMDILLKKTEKDVIPDTQSIQKCKMECARGDLGIIRARDGTQLVTEDEDAGLHGVLVMYAMNETDVNYRSNQELNPVFSGMLTAMYDTEVNPGEGTRNAAEEHSQLSLYSSITNGNRLGDGAPSSGVGRRRRGLEEELGDLKNLPLLHRSKRLTYSSAVFMANTMPREKGQEFARPEAFFLNQQYATETVVKFFGQNNGHTVQFDVRSDVTSDLQISGAGLRATYKFAQLHFHWGQNNDMGSEHGINGQSYPVEFHVVH